MYSKINIDKIKEDFDKVIRFSQGIEEPKTEQLFEKWKEAKQGFVEAFGGKLIYEYPYEVSFAINNEAKEERIQNLINFLWEIGMNDLSNFLSEERKGFYDNVVVEDFDLYQNSKKITIKKGTKLIKSFKYFLNDPKVLNDLQSKASRIIQENKIDGTLCFSVHPLDYLSVSENTYNWRSCHALDGEYRAGNLSYMMDKATVVCYLKGKEDTVLPRFPEDVPWNSKKWRVLLYVSEGGKMIFAGKQYPFETPAGMKFIVDKCLNCKDDSTYSMHWSDWISDLVSQMKTKNNIFYDFYHIYVPLGDGLIKLKELIKDAPGSKHFNDVLKSSTYHPPMYSILVKNTYWNNEITAMTDISERFIIGATTYCLHCGKEEVLEGSETMRCYDCELKYGTSENDCFGFCPKCGIRMDIEEGYWIDDEIYCKECFDTYASRCDRCEEYFLRENMIYDEENEEFYCTCCAEEE